MQVLIWQYKDLETTPILPEKWHDIATFKMITQVGFVGMVCKRVKVDFGEPAGELL